MVDVAPREHQEDYTLQLSDIPAALMLVSQVGATNAQRRRADRNAFTARYASVAASIHSAAAGAHADVAIRLRNQLLASDVNLERLENRVYELEGERSQLIALLSSVMDEVEVLRGRAY